MDDSTTRKLADILAGIDDIKEMNKYMEQPKVTDSFDNFKDYFWSLPSVRKFTDTELINLSNVEKSYYYQIRKGTRTPSRDKVLSLSIGAGLSVKETNRALELNGSAPLYPKNRRDIIITVGINQHASLIDINILLDKYGETPL
jgi:hypothetical protein